MKKIKGHSQSTARYYREPRYYAVENRDSNLISHAREGDQFCLFSQRCSLRVGPSETVKHYCNVLGLAKRQLHMDIRNGFSRILSRVN